MQAPIAFASTIVDITTEMMSQIAYVALGLALLLERAPMTPFTVSLVSALLVGLVGAAVVGGIFIFLQQRGTWLTDKLASRALPNTIAHAAAIAEALSAIYRAPRRVALSLAIHLVAWIASAAGSWIALRLMGVNVDLLAVIALDSLVYAIRSAAFVVPNALGVQEAAYATLAPLLGVGPELGVALSLLKRARDIAIGIPTLLIWQAMEGGRAFTDGQSDGEFLRNPPPPERGRTDAAQPRPGGGHY